VCTAIDSGEQSDAVNSTYVPSADQCSREVRLNGSVHEVSNECSARVILCYFISLLFLSIDLTVYGHVKTAEQRTIIQQYGDWYTGR